MSAPDLVGLFTLMHQENTRMGLVKEHTAYGVQSDTLAAYVAAERKKVWEEAAGYLETESHRLRNVGAASYRGMLAVAEIFRDRADKETHDAVA